jgi:hypothetical protein
MAAVAGPMRVMDWDFSALNLSPKHCRAESHLAPYTGKWVKVRADAGSSSSSRGCVMPGCQPPLTAPALLSDYQRHATPRHATPHGLRPLLPAHAHTNTHPHK